MTPDDEARRDEDRLLDEVGAAFARLRRRTTQVTADPSAPAPSRKDLSRNLVLNLVDEAQEEVTVGWLADQLGIDPSAASRAVADCITEGLLARGASQHDGRRTVLSITSEGDTLRRRFRSQQRAAFEQITADWPDDERLTFARLLVRYDLDAARLVR